MKRIAIHTYFAIIGIAVLLIACSEQSQDFTYPTATAGAREMLLQGINKADQFKFDEARRFFDDAIAADTTFAMAYYYRAQTAVSNADYNENLRHALKYINNTTPAESLLIMSMKAQSNDDQATAEVYLEQMVDLLPKSPRAHYILGLFFFGQQQWSAAEQELFETVGLDEEFAPAYNMLAYAYSNEGDSAKAIEALKQYSELRPDDPNPHDSMGEIYLRMGDYEKSLKEYQAALQIDSSFLYSHIGTGHNLVFTGKYDAARRQYDYLLTNARNFADTNEAYFWTALSYLYEGEPDRAIDTFRKQFDFAEGHEDTASLCIISGRISRIYLEKGDYGRALEEAEKQRELASSPGLLAATRESQLRDCNFTEAMIYSFKGDRDAARKCVSDFRQSAEATGSGAALADIHGLLGIVSYIDEDYRDAAIELEQANQMNMYQKYFEGLAYQKTGQENRASDTFEKIANRNRNDFAYSLIRSKAKAKI
jgi:tetratricopeptide (TPR) repeat protein